MIEILLMGVVVCLLVIECIRTLAVVRWMCSVVALRVVFPSGLTASQVAEWWATVHAALARPRAWGVCPVGWEIVSTYQGIEHVLVVPARLRGLLLPALFACLPGARVEQVPDYPIIAPRARRAAGFRLTDGHRPLAADRASTAARALLAACRPISKGETVRVRWLLSSAGVPGPVVAPVQPQVTGLDWWQRYRALRAYKRALEAAAAARTKNAHPLLLACVWVGVATPHGTARAAALVGRVAAGLRVMDAPGCRISRRPLPSPLMGGLMRRWAVPLLRWPLRVNTAELAGLAAIPLGEMALPGLPVARARQLPPSASLPRRGALIGVSTYPGADDRPLALSTVDRTRHIYVLGPAGSGKSVLLARLICGDIEAGYGLVAFDLKGDLIPDVLDRIKPADAERVLVVDAGAWDTPIGFNPLAGARTQADRELITDGVTTVFREIWAGFWGPRTDSILRACISTLLVARPVDGTCFTLCEMLPLLTDESFRHRITSQPGVTPALRAWWGRFDALSDGERAQHIGPLLNKLEAFTTRTAIRLMLGQSRSGLDFKDVLTKRRVVLVSLAQGTLGTETSALLGALLTFSLWRSILSRVTVPQAKRRFVAVYVDEAQTLVKLPVPLAEMLAQARGFGVGLTLANQYVAQLPPPVRSALLGTVRTHITFAPEHDDARLLAPHFPPLTADELIALPAFEFAMRPCIGGGPGPVVTGRSLPLPGATTDGAALAKASRSQYGTARADVDTALDIRHRGARGHTPRRHTPIDQPPPHSTTMHVNGGPS